MKKSTIVLVGMLAFLAGAASGTVCGILLAPIKKGINMHINFSFENCCNKNGILSKKKKKKKKSKGKSLPEKLMKSLPKKAAESAVIKDDNKINKEKKGSKKWIGQK